jgi:hypothetical protein
LCCALKVSQSRIKRSYHHYHLSSSYLIPIPPTLSTLSCLLTYGSVTAASKATRLYEQAASWLFDVGLRLDPEKTEFMIFCTRHVERHFGPHIPRLALQDPSNGEYSIKTSKVVRYLGIYFNPTLSWKEHVSIMASRARSSLAALGVLGNSVRGLDFANWRKVYLAVILPILTYGSPIWFTDIRQKGLVQPLQVAQNQACRRLSGAFHTTPTAPLHHLLCIPPVGVGSEDRWGREPQGKEEAPEHLVRPMM